MNEAKAKEALQALLDNDDRWVGIGLLQAALAEQPAAPAVTDEIVRRFLSWPLPKDFCPDCGINFDGRKDDQWNKNKTWPIGTNLFTAEQARAMLEHVLGAKK